MNNPWFRMYAGVINDPKVMKLPEATRWHWVACLCVASDHGGKLPPAPDLAFALRMSEQRAAVLVTELYRAGLLDKVDGGFAPHNWSGRQYQSDSSTKRVRDFRERKKREAGVTGNVSPDVTVTPPEQSRTETEQSRADAPRAGQIDLVEEALRADLREILGSHVNLTLAAEWLGKGYDPGMIREVVRDLRRRKPDVASLAYFEAALAERHAKRAETPSERAGYAAVTDFDKVISMFVRTGVWSRYAGPEPGMLGCRAPLELLAKHGIDGATGNKIRKAG
ncbi:hypothetical protein [Bradyrhizobium retamae]|uniref:Uncharacterized protein n=1 Tax=Bradyrhizobium retamae TaxID=1300035 RepID=A0A0R3MNT5_9BRAD|nr:hypothetical protein [Bradyrhizobium retamae]KRR21892.1 hypothetical protein CQ13_07605 [Bradyrhizobium retamae]